MLTVAHLDHDHRRGDPADLAAMRQHCQNVYDGPQHAATRPGLVERSWRRATFSRCRHDRRRNAYGIGLAFLGNDNVYARLNGGGARAAEAHYPTMTTPDIAALPVGGIVATAAALYLWATAPMPPDALTVIDAWGFRYVPHLVWVKDRAETGDRVRNRHELLLIGTRGAMPGATPGRQPESMIKAETDGHSVKPAVSRWMIDQEWPSLRKIELFCRGPAAGGWACWGNEALPAPAPSKAEGAA